MSGALSACWLAWCPLQGRGCGSGWVPMLAAAAAAVQQRQRWQAGLSIILPRCVPLCVAALQPCVDEARPDAVWALFRSFLCAHTGLFFDPTPLHGRSYVWMWHAMMGFWAGVAPPSEAPDMAKYGARVSVKGGEGGSKIHCRHGLTGQRAIN